MYLFLKAHDRNEDFDGDVPEFAVVDVGKQRDYLEDCVLSAEMLSSQAKRAGSVVPQSIAFKAGETPRWIRYDLDLEDFDFYEELSTKGAALVRELPSVVREQVDFERDIKSDNNRIVVEMRAGREFGIEAVIASGRVAVFTHPFSIDAVKTMTPYDGISSDEEMEGPSR